MQSSPLFSRSFAAVLAGCWVSLVAAAPLIAATTTTRRPGQSNELWQRTVEALVDGQFEQAASLVSKSDPTAPTLQQVKSWLEKWQEQENARHEARKEDLEKYIRYANERVLRQEFDHALGWLLRAKDVADDPDALLKQDWVHRLINQAIERAELHRKDDEWREAWGIYSLLSSIFEREPRYKKLEREAVTHLRLEAMFGKDSHWDERIERVEWRDARTALEYIEAYYVEPPDFKQITEGGLEQVLLLAESKSARDVYPGLASEFDRNDFIARVRQNLEQVRQSPSVNRRECIKRFARVVETINEQTIRLPESLIVSELMRGAFEPLDEFTTMIWPRETEEFEKHTRGDFIGVGISIIKNMADQIEVVTPLEDTPAFRAGIQAGDIITHVDGESLAGKSLTNVVQTITGPMDTSVTLTIRRGEKELSFPLKRAKVKIQSVKGWNRNEDESWDFWRDRENGIGYVRLTNFQRNTPEDLTNVLSELQAKGLKGLILDLRGNPGGLLDSAWQITSLFLNRGSVVVSTKGRIPEDDQTLPVLSNGPYRDFPLVVLVDQSSASASEIVSGATRDNDRATVVGDRTFGKFSVQNLIPLGPSRAKLKVTTARYYLPSGASLHREPNSDTWGVEPDISVPLCRKERSKVYQLRRKADMIGPQGETTIDEMMKSADDEEDEQATDAELAGADGENKADDVRSRLIPWPLRQPTSKELARRGLATVVNWTTFNGLPPLAQPDPNKRPDIDPQVDAALLVLRVKVLGDRFPTLATAEPESTTKTAKP
jgi:carboxyl-terminal processing protease